MSKNLYNNATVDVHQGLQTFLSQGHISYYTTVQRPNILHNVIDSRYVTFYQINKFFISTVLSLLKKWFHGLEEMALWAVV